MFLKKTNINGVIRVFRQLHSCGIQCSMKRQSKMLAKLMTGSHRKKKNWYLAESQARMPLLPTSKPFQEGALKKSRTDVLNKLFMRHITDMLSTGEVTTDLVGHGISITRVKVVSDFSAVNVYWTVKGSSHDMELERALEKAAFNLRHELSQLHIMGVVPRIHFVADKGHIFYEVMEQCFEKLKLKGELDETDPAEHLRSEQKIEGPLDPHILEKIRRMEEDKDGEETETEKGEIEIHLPEMTHEVLGLNHSNILKKIQVAVVKSEARHRTTEVSDDPECTLQTMPLVNFAPNGSESDIAKFITKQRILKKKILQAQRKKLLDTSLDSGASNEEEYVDIADGDFVEEFELISKRR